MKSQKILMLYVTGVPGIIRLGLVMYIEHFYPISVVGGILSDMSVVQLASFFTAIGWSGLIMVQPNEDVGKKRYGEFLISSSVSYLIIVPLIFLLYWSGYVYHIYETLLFLFSWTVYQVSRHYCLYNKSYLKISISEIFSVVVFVFFIFMNFHVLTAASLGYFVFLILNLPNNIFNSRKGCLKIQEIKKAWEISISNFLAGSGVYSLPVVVAPVLSHSYAALIGFSTSLLLILHLIPRAISNYFLPEISKSLNEDFSKAALMHSKQVIFSFVSVLFLFIFSMSVFLFLHTAGFTNVLKVEYSMHVVFLVSLIVLLSVCGLPYTDIMNALGDTSYTAKCTYIYGFGIFAVSFIFTYLANGVHDLFLMLSLYVVMGFCRVLFLRKRAICLLGGENA